jgi:Xaa-Pro aminopeptidase
VADQRPRRLAALRESIAASHLDGLLLTSLPNIRYLTGFSGSSALVMATARRVLLVTDFRYQTQVAAEVGDFAQVLIESQSLWAALWRTLPSLGGDTYGFESAHLLHRDFQRLLDGGAQWQWRPAAELVERLREQKDEGEVALIRQAIAAAEQALGETVPRIAAGMTELAVAGMLESALRGAGSEGFPFPTIVAAGARAALPHARSSTRVLERNDWLLIDFGAVVDGYCSDITRTFVLGRADDRQREIHGIVREANARAAAAIAPGMLGKDADAVARRYIEDCGHGAAFGHSLGHGIGLEVHEAPRLASTSEGLLPAGTVVTIEPGIYLPDWGGVRIEDDVYLDGSGSRILTTFTRELLELA